MAFKLDLDKKIDFLAKYQSPPPAEKCGPPTPYEFYKADTRATIGEAPLDEFAFRRLSPRVQSETVLHYHIQAVEQEKRHQKTKEEFQRVAQRAHAAVAARELREQREFGMEERLGAW